MAVSRIRMPLRGTVFMKLAKLTQMFSIIFLICFATAQGQQAVASPSPTPEVSAEKRAMIKEILDLTNSRKSSEAMFSAQFDEMERQMPETQWQAISSLDEFKKLTPAQQRE